MRINNLIIQAIIRTEFYCFLFLIAFSGYSQKESANWYFGYNAGLNFNGESITALLDGQLDTNEGCATISNSKGELLFYTNGVIVWDRNHVIMPNGEGLLGNSSSTQSAIIVPKPKSDHIYYIFTVTSGGRDDGLRYSEVNLNLNNGDGDITSNKNVLLTTPCAEKITAVQHANGSDFWIMTHSWNGSDFLAFRVSQSGVESIPVTTTIGSFHGGEDYNSIGYMKFSPNGTKLALAKWSLNSMVEIFDFDCSKGIVSNPIEIDTVFDKSSLTGAYGLEFSPNSRFLYVTGLDFSTFTSELYQFDLSLPSKNDIINTHTLLYCGNNLLSALQLALDGRIYVSNSSSDFLGVINNPNINGESCNYLDNAVELNGRSATFGLPSFIQSFFVASLQVEDLCLGNNGNFKINTEELIEEVVWDFGDGTTATDFQPQHNYTKAGTYDILTTFKSGSNIFTLRETVEVYDMPILEKNFKWSICNNEATRLFLNSNHDAYLWSTGERTSEIIVDKPGIYTVTTYNFWPDGLGTCENSVDIELVNSSMPEIVDIEIRDWTSDDNVIEVRVAGFGSYEYSLDNVNYQESNLFNDLKSGEYMVYVRDVNGCGYAKKDVYVLNYPKYFTPNGDGYHDYWKINFLNAEPDITIHIFDRYGKLLKQLNPTSLGWDGKYNGVLLSSSDYWFVMNRPSKGKNYTGHFTLKI